MSLAPQQWRTRRGRVSSSRRAITAYTSWRHTLGRRRRMEEVEEEMGEGRRGGGGEALGISLVY